MEIILLKFPDRTDGPGKSGNFCSRILLDIYIYISFFSMGFAKSNEALDTHWKIILVSSHLLINNQSSFSTSLPFTPNLHVQTLEPLPLLSDGRGGLGGGNVAISVGLGAVRSRLPCIQPNLKDLNDVLSSFRRCRYPYTYTMPGARNASHIASPFFVLVLVWWWWWWWWWWWCPQRPRTSSLIVITVSRAKKNTGIPSSLCRD